MGWLARKIKRAWRRIARHSREDAYGVFSKGPFPWSYNFEVRAEPRYPTGPYNKADSLYFLASAFLRGGPLGLEDAPRDPAVISGVVLKDGTTIESFAAARKAIFRDPESITLQIGCRCGAPLRITADVFEAETPLNFDAMLEKAIPHLHCSQCWLEAALIGWNDGPKDSH